MKPTLVTECQAQGKGCNIGRRKTINLTKAISLELEDKTVQCSAVSAKLTGAVFQSGLNMTQFKRSLRRSGLKVSNTKVDQVVDTYMEAKQLNVNMMNNKKINNAYKLVQNTNVAVDTSFSQSRNAQYSQPAALEKDSGELVHWLFLTSMKKPAAQIS